MAAAFPVARIVGFDAGAGTQQAEEGVLRRIGYDSGMSAPDDQVARLWVWHLLEFVDPGVEVGRVCVFVGEAGALVKCVDKVGTVVSAFCATAKIQCGAENCETLVRGERLGRGRLLARLTTARRRTMTSRFDPMIEIRLQIREATNLSEAWTRPSKSKCNPTP